MQAFLLDIFKFYEPHIFNAYKMNNQNSICVELIKNFHRKKDFSLKTHKCIYLARFLNY